MNLNNAVALITGGAQGLGRSFVQNLLKRGTRVIVADLNADVGEKFVQECSQTFGEDTTKFIKCDVTNKSQFSKVMEEAKDTFGRLDILCNNAGIMTNDPARARLQVEVNLISVIEGTYKGIDLMSTQNGGNGGVVVNIGSAAGIDLMMQAAVFSATKHAVVAFSRSFHSQQYFERDGVRVNTICPFFCETAMVEKAVSENPANERVIRKIGMVQIEDVADGFMRVVEDEDMNGGVLVVAPNRKIYQLQFGVTKLLKNEACEVVNNSLPI